MGYNCYQKFKNRNPYIRLTRYLAIRNGVKTYIRWCSIGTGIGNGMDNNRSIYSVSDLVEQKERNRSRGDTKIIHDDSGIFCRLSK